MSGRESLCHKTDTIFAELKSPEYWSNRPGTSSGVVSYSSYKPEKMSKSPGKLSSVRDKQNRVQGWNIHDFHLAFEGFWSPKRGREGKSYFFLRISIPLGMRRRSPGSFQAVP